MAMRSPPKGETTETGVAARTVSIQRAEGPSCTRRTGSKLVEMNRRRVVSAMKLSSSSTRSAEETITMSSGFLVWRDRARALGKLSQTDVAVSVESESQLIICDADWKPVRRRRTPPVDDTIIEVGIALIFHAALSESENNGESISKRAGTNRPAKSALTVSLVKVARSISLHGPHHVAYRSR